MRIIKLNAIDSTNLFLRSLCLDTHVEDLPSYLHESRLWDIGDNPKTAVHEFIAGCANFEIDQSIQHKLVLTSAPDGYLKCIA